jgi:pyrimidine-nucleoside phosphorylase
MVGMASMLLGAGRETKESEIDLGAGIELKVKRGEWVDKGMPLATLYTNAPGRLAEAVAMLESAYRIGPDKPAERPLIFGKVNEVR